LLVILSHYHVYLKVAFIVLSNPHVLTDTTNIKNDVMPPPGRGNGSDPELLDSPIGLFHYPSPGALLRLPGSFLF